VRQLISVPKAIVAGSYVLEGKITNASQVRIIRNGIVVHEGKIESLRRFKDDVKEVAAGYECGITIEKYRDIKEGDIIEAFTMELVKPS
jgi:translation initiation factor IF-2